MGYKEKFHEATDDPECLVCGRSASDVEIEVHHRDGDRSNDDLDNLVALCILCHRKVHHGGYWKQNDDFRELERDLHGELFDPAGETRKIRKNFSLSSAVVKRLEGEDNMTGLVERLLRDYYGMGTREQYNLRLKSDAADRVDCIPNDQRSTFVSEAIMQIDLTDYPTGSGDE